MANQAIYEVTYQSRYPITGDVYTEDVGYVTGELPVIKAYYKVKLGFVPDITRIKPQAITKSDLEKLLGIGG